MKNKPCKHRLEKDICLASWATPYDEIYECKTKRKGCPCYEEEMMDKHNSEYELGRQTENMDKSREWVKENDMNREQAHLITVADHKKIVSELEKDLEIKKEFIIMDGMNKVLKDEYCYRTKYLNFKKKYEASQKRVEELEIRCDKYIEADTERFTHYCTEHDYTWKDGSIMAMPEDCPKCLSKELESLKQSQELVCYSCGEPIKYDNDRPECYCNDCLPMDSKLKQSQGKV